MAGLEEEGPSDKEAGVTSGAGSEGRRGAGTEVAGAGEGEGEGAGEGAVRNAAVPLS